MAGVERPVDARDRPREEFQAIGDMRPDPDRRTLRAAESGTVAVPRMMRDVILGSS